MVDPLSALAAAGGVAKFVNECAKVLKPTPRLTDTEGIANPYLLKLIRSCSSRTLLEVTHLCKYQTGNPPGPAVDCTGVEHLSKQITASLTVPRWAHREGETTFTYKNIQRSPKIQRGCRQPFVRLIPSEKYVYLDSLRKLRLGQRNPQKPFPKRTFITDRYQQAHNVFPSVEVLHA